MMREEWDRMVCNNTLPDFEPHKESADRCIHGKKHMCVDCALRSDVNTLADQLAEMLNLYPVEIILEQLAKGLQSKRDESMKSYMRFGDAEDTMQAVKYDLISQHILQVFKGKRL